MNNNNSNSISDLSFQDNSHAQKSHNILKRAASPCSEEIEPKIPHIEDVSLKFNPSTFKLVKVLKNDSKIKSLVLHCSVEEQDAIVILQKIPFPADPEKIKAAGLTDQNEDSKFSKFVAKTLQSNDVYNTLLIQTGLEAINEVNMTVIYPAQANHFLRFTTSGLKMINESSEMYTNRVVPFLEENPKDLIWVQNIIDGKAEHDRVLFHNENEEFGFTIVLDYRWNCKRVNELHCLGIARNKNIKCLRDLTDRHIPMLEEMLNQGRIYLSRKFEKGTDDDQSKAIAEEDIVAYFHYPPTFYWLHMHFVHVDGPDDSTTRAGRAHLVEEVIRNLKIDGHYYKKRTMTLFLSNKSPMLKLHLKS